MSIIDQIVVFDPKLRKRVSLRRPKKNISPLAQLKLPYKTSPKRHTRDSERTANSGFGPVEAES